MGTITGTGIFGCPGGEVTVEVPDGVTKTMPGGVVHNSLTNSDYANGGPYPDGYGYGAFGAFGTVGDDAFSLAEPSEKQKFKID